MTIHRLLDVLDAYQHKGAIDASTNPDYPAASAGHTYRISVAGKIGGASGVNVEVGDTLVCDVDDTATGDHATVGANWTILQSNIDGAVAGPASSVDENLGSFDGVSGKSIKDSGLSTTAVGRALGVAVSTELTVSDGEITLTLSSHTVDTEGDAATDELDTVDISVIANGGFFALAPASSSRTVTLMHETGNYVSPTGRDIAIDRPIMFQKSADGTSFTEISGSAVSTSMVTLDDLGAAGDAMELFDGTINGTTTLSSASYSFTSADVGKRICVMRAMDKGTNLHEGCFQGTIASVNSGNAVLSGAVDESISGTTHFAFGTDDSAKWTEANALISANKGGTLYATPGKKYWIGVKAVPTHCYHLELTGAEIFVHDLDSVDDNTIANEDHPAFLKLPGISHFNNTDKSARRSASTTAAADIVEGSKQIEVASVSGIAPGDFVAVQSTETSYEITELDVNGHYPWREYNKVERVDPDTDIIYLRWPIQTKTLETSEGAITVMTYTPIPGQMLVTGGRFVSYGYKNDVNNGAGQHIFCFNNTDKTEVRGTKFWGITGYGLCGMHNTQLKAYDLDFVGRPSDISFVEAKTSHYGAFAFHASRETFLHRSEGLRIRHLVDGFHSGTTGAYWCRANETRTSAFRTHIGVNKFVVMGCESDFCDISIAPEARKVYITGFKGTNGFNYGFLCNTGSYFKAVESDTYLCNVNITLESNVAGAEVASAVHARSPYNILSIKDCDFTMKNSSGDTATADLVKILQAEATSYVKELSYRKNKHRMHNCKAASRALVLGGTADMQRVKGIVRENEFYCKDQTEIIALYDPPGSSEEGLSIIHNEELSRDAITAPSLVSLNGADFTGNTVIHSNYSRRLDAFPQRGTFAADIRPDQTDGEVTLSLQSGRYYLNENMCTVVVDASISSKGTASAGDYLYVGELPYPIAANHSDSKIANVRNMTGAHDYSRNAWAMASAVNTPDNISLRISSASDGSQGFLTVADISDTFRVSFSITYPVDLMIKS